MPSPFPRMNPYLEQPEVWSQVHKFASEHINGDIILKPPNKAANMNLFSAIKLSLKLF